MTTIPINPYKVRGHAIPPTPAPASRETMEVNAKDRFAGILWISKAPNKSMSDYLSDYHHYEVYDESKSYSKRTYIDIHNGRVSEYHNYLCVITDEKEETQTWYVVAKRLSSELETLEPYCTCITCCSSVCNPLKYLWCPSCTKCIKAGPGIASPELIEKAKQLRTTAEKDKLKPPHKWQQYISTKTLVHGAEITLLTFIVAIAAYLT